METNETIEDSKTDCVDTRSFLGLSDRTELSQNHVFQLCLQNFGNWSSQRQVEFVKELLSRMDENQCQGINSYLNLELKRDFISLLIKSGLDHIAEQILTYLDPDSLHMAELASNEWQQVIKERLLWKKIIQNKINTDSMWNCLAERQGWRDQLLTKKKYCDETDLSFYKALYDDSMKQIHQAKANWKRGRCNVHSINCNTEDFKGVYCIQFDSQKIISGDKGNTIKIWNYKTLHCCNILRGHSGSVLCLQFDNEIIISGSSDSTIRIWDITTGKTINILSHHSDAVVCVRYIGTKIISSSKDSTIAVWDKISPTNIILRRVLLGHQSSVNVVDFDQKYIISASIDRTIKVWDTSTCDFLRTINNKQITMCMQYKYPFVVNGCADNRIKIWDVDGGVCLRVLQGHRDIVRCIRFNSERIISGSYDGSIKIWNTSAALNPSIPGDQICLKTLAYHEARIFGIQVDEFQIVSSSLDDTIKIFDFLGWLEPGSTLQEDVLGAP